MLLMIPGPIEVSPAVCEAFSVSPPSHLAPHVIEAHGASLERMREVWLAPDDAQPFIVPGSGTIAMEMAVANLVDEGDSVLVVNTGYFSDRIAEMARRRSATVVEIKAAPGRGVDLDEVRRTLGETSPSVLFATHVDTSTGVRVDPEPLCLLAREHDTLTVFDGVCATAAERFEMDAWGADVYLTASQKAIGLPVGLGMLVCSTTALAHRRALKTPVPMALDWFSWLPIMQAYEDRRPSYFSTPASNLLLALAVSLDEILVEGMEARFALHQRAANSMRSAWDAMGLEMLCEPAVAANTLSAVRYPEGIGPELVGAIKARGVVVAPGLYPGLNTTYFRVGHMGYSATQRDHLLRTVRAVAGGLADLGVDVEAPHDLDF